MAKSKQDYIDLGRQTFINKDQVPFLKLGSWQQKAFDEGFEAAKDEAEAALKQQNAEVDEIVQLHTDNKAEAIRRAMLAPVVAHMKALAAIVTHGLGTNERVIRINRKINELSLRWKLTPDDLHRVFN